MNRGRLLVNLAMKNQEVVPGRLRPYNGSKEKPELFESSTPSVKFEKDQYAFKNLPQMTGSDKVYHYLQNASSEISDGTHFSRQESPHKDEGCVKISMTSNSSDTEYIPPTDDEESSFPDIHSSNEEDYVPSSVSSTSDGEDSAMEHNSVVVTAGRSQRTNLRESVAQPVRQDDFEKRIVSGRETTERTEKSTDKDLCTFCYEEVSHFSRHLFRRHCDEDEVGKILEMPLKSNERRTAIIALRKRGNFLWKQKQNHLKPRRKHHSKFFEKAEKVNDKDYAPCVSCLGFYKKTYLWRHRKICKSNAINKNDNRNSKTQHLGESQTFLAVTGLLGNFLNKSRLKEEVFAIMRPDDISFAAKTDPLICLYGESYLNKHKRKQMNVVVSNKMRELARLKIALTNSSVIKSLFDVLRPDMYEKIIAATKVICGYNTENHTFRASSLALHLGTSLKFLCDTAKKAIITKHNLLSYHDRDESIKNVTELKEMITSHWCNDISSLANKALNENKYEKPKLLPLTEDVQIFNNHINTLANEAYEKLKLGDNISKNYKLLSECVLSAVLVFNRKRIGEVQFLDIESYRRDVSAANQQECLNSLTEFEKTMSTTFKRVIVFGKGSKPVPILFTKKMQKFIALLIDIRQTTDIVPKSNKYLFANPGSTDRWMSGASILRKFAKNCGAKNPELLTSTRFRKQIATILQLMNFENHEMEQIARFMGHTEKTHLEFYRLTEDVYQTAKVAKVLLLLNSGRGADVKGKHLHEIEVTEAVIDDDPVGTKCSEEEHDFHSAPSITEHHDNPQALPERSEQSRRNRIQWTAKKKRIALAFFNKHVKSKVPPKKEECLNLIKKHTDLFKESDWVRIKAFIYNTYRNE